jgi:hypothetical protein
MGKKEITVKGLDMARIKSAYLAITDKAETWSRYANLATILIEEAKDKEVSFNAVCDTLVKDGFSKATLYLAKDIHWLIQQVGLKAIPDMPLRTLQFGMSALKAVGKNAPGGLHEALDMVANGHTTKEIKLYFGLETGDKETKDKDKELSEGDIRDFVAKIVEAGKTGLVVDAFKLANNIKLDLEGIKTQQGLTDQERAKFERMEVTVREKANELDNLHRVNKALEDKLEAHKAMLVKLENERKALAAMLEGPSLDYMEAFHLAQSEVEALKAEIKKIRPKGKVTRKSAGTAKKAA